MAEDLKVFISWSGPLSKAIAQELMDLLRVASDRIRPFMSDLSIESGTRGLGVIADELRSTSVGILVVTKDNWQSPWLNYEAGALSKEVADIESRVIPLLVDLDGSDMASTPLVQYQYRPLDKTNIRRLLTELAILAGADPETTVEPVMPRWPSYESRIAKAIAEGSDAAVEGGPSEGDLLKEILETVRDIQRAQPTPKSGVDLEKTPEQQEASRRRAVIRRMAQLYGYRGVLSLSQSNDGTWVVLTDASAPAEFVAAVQEAWGTAPLMFRQLIRATQPEES